MQFPNQWCVTAVKWCTAFGAQATVKEAVLFSARMRLAESVPVAKVHLPRFGHHTL